MGVGRWNILVLNSSVHKALNISEQLKKEGFAAQVVADSKVLFKKLLSDEISVLLLDVDLPSEDIMMVEKYLIINPSLIVIAIGSDMTKSAEYLKAGCDRFLDKKLETDQILNNVISCYSTIKRRGIELNDHKKNAWTLVASDLDLVLPSDEKIPLTVREFRFLELLFRSSGKVVKKEEAIKHVIGRNYNNSDQRLNLMLTRLRKKIKKNTDIELPVKTEYTVGYIFSSKCIVKDFL